VSRARLSLGILVAGYFAIAVVAGAPNSPLTVLLPAGVRPPSWATHLAKLVGLDHVGRVSLTAVAWILVVTVMLAFAVVLREAWLKRISLSAILVASVVSLAISVAAPLLLSHDVLTYAGYGRVDTTYHHNPYVTTLASFPHDRFARATPGQWLHTHSPYGPLFTLVSQGIARTGATILMFKLLAGIAIAAATVFVALTAKRTRPDRAPFAAALVGLNPVIVVHTVGGGHVDALIAGLLAGAAAVAVTGPAIVVTVLLTAAVLVKSVMFPALALWLWWIARRKQGLSLHVAVVVALTLASLVPYLDGWQTLTPLASLGGVESWASPSHLVGHAIHAVTPVEVAFLLVFVVLVVRLARRTVADACGTTLLLLALSMPFLLPWYAAWFAPFLGLLADEVLLWAGAFVTVVLGLTLIPADPFHGLTTPAVMDGVHYGAASVLLVIYAVVVLRISGGRARRAHFADARRAMQVVREARY
jgi:alpha-1,6-mannosyltransferase